MKKYKHILATFIVVIVISLNILTLVSADTEGQSMYFTVYGKNYYNKSKTQLQSTSIRGTVDIVSRSGQVPTGYIATLPRLYDEDGALVASSSWTYNSSPCLAMSYGTAPYSTPGTYYSQGQTKVYNGNGYTTQTSYRTPNESFGNRVSLENGEAITEKNFDPEKIYSKNKDGQTYGSALYAVSPQAEPDLIIVKNVDGVVGYVYKNVLNGPEPRNPEEAIEMQNSSKGLPRSIPIYASDGKTVLGNFELLPQSVTLEK